MSVGFGRYSRRSFFNRLGLSALTYGASPLLSGAPDDHAFAACTIQTHGLLSPGLEKFALAIEPGSDPFLCERYAADLNGIFQEWSRALCSAPGDTTKLSAALASEISFTPFDRFEAKILRTGSAIQADAVEFAAAETTGRLAFSKSMAAYFAPFSRIHTAEFLITELKITQPSPVVAEVRLRYDLVGSLHEDKREERTGWWSLTCHADRTGKWQIRRWRADRETRTRVAGLGFRDVTAQALRGNREAQEQFAHGIDYWRGQIDGAIGPDVYGNNGVAVGDFYGDGFDGIYVCQPSGLPNRLFRNRGDGTFEDVTQASGLGLLDGTASALFADFTGSGTQDLIVVRTSGPLLYLNQGHGKFELKADAFRFAKPPSGTFTGIAAADYNRDGLLDIYFCLYAYYQGLSQYTHPQPYYDAQNGPPNFLMRNRGDGTFEDVTASSGMNENNNRYSFACGWCDFDNDGWPDLYVANDFGRKNLYRNNRDGTFHDLAHEMGVEDFGAGMSVSWFDYDNDGRQDLYVTDMYSAAGTRVTAQDVFLPNAPPEIRAAYRKHASGNSLFNNKQESIPFADVSQSAQINLGRWSWSGDAWDFDHDGTTDLYVTNGFISGPNRYDLASFFWRQIVARSLDVGASANDYQLAWNAINELIRSDYSWNGYERNVFFLNNGDRTFSEISGPLGLDFEDDSRAFALADFDGDGRLEVVLKNRTGPQLRILHNDLHPIGNSVTIRLRGRESNRDAIGAVVTIESGSGMQVKCVQAGSGFLSQHTKDLSFGLGSQTSPVNGTVQWPSGAKQRLEKIPPQYRVTVEEGNPVWKARPFRKQTAVTDAAQPFKTEMLPTRSDSWLVEPLPALDFSLRSLDGQTYRLKSFAGKPLLLALVSGGCENSREQLAQLASAWNAFTRQMVQVAALDLNSDPQPMRDFARRQSIPFPVLLADKNTTGVYSILYRYLFDRRRDIETPTLLLMDRDNRMIKVNRGKTKPTDLLGDFASELKTAESQLARALPFAGSFHGDLPRRNFFTYGIAFIQSGYTDAALTCFQSSVARNPNYAAAYYNIGTIYLNKQMLPEAKASLEKAVLLDPQDADALTNLGSVFGQQNDYDSAYRYFEQALQVKPTHLVALQNLVMLDRWKGQIDNAQRRLQKAIVAAPTDPEFHFALGMLLAGQNKFSDARRELERTVALRPDDSIALNNLGVVFLRLGETTEALQCFQRCIKLAPDYDRPFLNIASIYQSQGKPQQAREILQSFLSRHPDNTELAKALESIGR